MCSTNISVNERVKIIRKRMGLTMEAFGKRVGVTRSAISNIENGNRGVTKQMVNSMCREFGVREAWLLTGEGQMFDDTNSHELDALVERYGLAPAERSLIEKFVMADSKIRAMVISFLTDISPSTAEVEDVEKEPDTSGKNTTS